MKEPIENLECFKTSNGCFVLGKRFIVIVTNKLLENRLAINSDYIIRMNCFYIAIVNNSINSLLEKFQKFCLGALPCLIP